MNKKIPFVSIIIPVFNGAAYLAETIESIRLSTYKNYEVILVDDGSTDNSKLMCRAFAKIYRNVHFYSFAKNQGMDRVLNFALRKARGEYICRINQDDKMKPYRLSWQVKYLMAHPEVVAVGSHIKLFEPSTSSGPAGKNKPKFETIVKFFPTDARIKKFWLFLSPFSDPTVMYRKEVALQVGGYKQEFWPADDVHMWYKMGRVGKLANIQRVLVDVRWHKNAGSLKYFRYNTRVTYKLHQWAHKNIQKAGIWTQAFWIGQLIAGHILSPDFNWAVYRGLKRFINGLSFTKNASFRLAVSVHRNVRSQVSLRYQVA